jgi:hypothetical protein
VEVEERLIFNLAAKRRVEIIRLLGGKCVKCGFSDIRALQIDHLNGGGCKEYQAARNSYDYYRKILEKVKAGSKEYQVLCANCNTIKKHVNKEVS